MFNSKKQDAGFFYEQRDRITRSSAERILEIVFEYMKPQSVVDVGCGVGTWLDVCRRHSVKEVLGIDGNHIDPSLLQIPPNSFRTFDLSQPLDLGRRFDLAISLEVAEHLPNTAAGLFVQTLTSLSHVVLFSAAIPGQGGFQHVNEQWPSYWVKLFEEYGYQLVDNIRPQVWNDPTVNTCYRQNTLIFLDKDILRASSPWRKAFQQTRQNQINLVHPDLFVARSMIVTPNLSSWCAVFPTLFHRSVKGRLSRVYRALRKTRRHRVSI